MDNITHSLAGVLLAEAAVRLLPASHAELRARTRHGVFVTIGIVASNLPDADFIYPLITHSKLDYLSQHRGYTHTAVGVVFGAICIALVAELWCRWRRVRPQPRDRWAFFGLALAALALHVAMDFTNSYGVHPFWPFYNGWLYGDSVFIVEPALWVAAAPLFFILRSHVARGLIALVLIASMLLSFASGWIPLPIAGVLAIVLVILLAIAKYTTPARALALACAVWVAITAVFSIASQIAAREVTRLHAALYPDQALLDHVLTPMPANPLCWDIIAVVARGQDYGLRRGVLSLAPSLLSPYQCGDKNLQAPTTAQLQPVVQPQARSLFWQDEWYAPRQTLISLVHDHCEAQILIRFARAPFVRDQPRLVVGDLRYDREPGAGFAEVVLESEPTRCTSRVPPWGPPRADLLAR
jgi:inner membrane protein